MTTTQQTNTVAEVAEMAHRAGLAAGNSVIPTPMVVVNSTTEQIVDIVDDGLCGFAWVTIRPARGAFVNYLKAKDWGSRGYSGGWEIWVSNFNQSMTRKEAYAKAFAAVLQNYGINATAGSRLD